MQFSTYIFCCLVVLDLTALYDNISVYVEQSSRKGERRGMIEVKSYRLKPYHYLLQTQYPFALS